MKDDTDFAADYPPDDYWDEEPELPKEHWERVDKTIGVINALNRIFRGDFGPYGKYLKLRATFQFEQARLLGLQPYSVGYMEIERLERAFKRENRKLEHPEDYIIQQEPLEQ